MTRSEIIAAWFEICDIEREIIMLSERCGEFRVEYPKETDPKVIAKMQADWCADSLLLDKLHMRSIKTMNEIEKALDGNAVILPNGNVLVEVTYGVTECKVLEK